MSEEIQESVSSIAGAIVEAVREGLNRNLNPLQQQRTVSTPLANQTTPAVNSATLYQRVSAVGSSSPCLRRDQLAGPSRAHAGGSRSSAEDSSSRKRYCTPSMFLPKRSRRADSQPKRTTYVRDIFCLPRECQGKSGTVVVPRGARRSALASEEVGLFGKIEFQSDWTAERMREEICCSFSKAFQLSPEDVDEGKLFPFDYLQRTGAGSRTLCVPSVSQSFEWNGRQVSTLAKSGGVIYILARRDIPLLGGMEDPQSSPLTSDSPSSPYPTFDCAISEEPQQPDSDVIVISDEHTVQLSASQPSTLPSTSQFASQPSTSKLRPSDELESPEPPPSPCALDELLTMFVGRLSAKQVLALYHASGEDFDASMECLLEGPTLSSIVCMLNTMFSKRSVTKLEVDAEDVWQDMVVHYKSPRIDLKKQLRIGLLDQPAIDTDGVRRQVYNTVYDYFITNKYVKLFDGPSHSRRPLCTAESRSSGLFKLLGTMVGHSIGQDGIGFPHFSPACFWYLVGGEQRAIEFVTLDDIGADAAAVVSKLKTAESESDIAALIEEDSTLDILQRCSITTVVNVSTKEIVAQDIITHDAVYKISQLLDQFCDGLKKLHLLKLLRAFPELFITLFTYVGDIDAVDVMEAIFVHKDTKVFPGDEVTLRFLNRFIQGCSKTDLRAFLLHVTSKRTVSKQSVQVDFLEDSTAIAAHTCSSLLVFPRNAYVDTESSFANFCAAMKAVILSPMSFNMV